MNETHAQRTALLKKRDDVLALQRTAMADATTKYDGAKVAASQARITLDAAEKRLGSAEMERRKVTVGFEHERARLDRELRALLPRSLTLLTEIAHRVERELSSGPPSPRALVELNAIRSFRAWARDCHEMPIDDSDVFDWASKLAEEIPSHAYAIRQAVATKEVPA
jgi:hypothetical protein